MHRRPMCCLIFGLLASAGIAQAQFAFRVTQDWGTGFQGEIEISNNTPNTVSDWTLDFDFNRTIDSIWNAQKLSHVGAHYKIKNAGWNSTILPGGKVTFGFVANPGNVNNQPTNYVLGSGSSGGGGGGGATGKPGMPSLSVQIQPDGTARAEWNMWYGNNGTQWQLIEDGTVIASATIPDGTPNAQTGATVITGREYAAKTYQVALSNTFGETRSQEVNFTFGGASKIIAAPLDSTSQARQETIALTSTNHFSLRTQGVASPSYSVIATNPSVVFATIAGNQLTLKGLTSGRTSVRIKELSTGEVRFLGVRVKTATGGIPQAPSLAIGSVSEDTPGDLSFWQDISDSRKNKRIDIRYIYLNGGPENGWRTWSATDGGRVTSYLRESQKLGMIPYFVWYNIPDGGESYFTNKQHIESTSYLRGYFRDLRFALELIAQNAGDDPVGFILEPDFIGYIMQNSGHRPAQVLAMTNAAYDEGVLSRTIDPNFPNNLNGLVQSINYTIKKYAPNVKFGWQFNLWASPGVHVGIPAKGLLRLTDTMGVTAGRAAIAAEATEIASYYIEAGILTHGASHVSLDKYGLDAGAESGAGTNPANSTWFWNLDHWNNYLLFASVLKQRTSLPVVLWQLPVGRINSSQTISPYTNAFFPNLSNTNRQFEDSASTFFFGDTFSGTGARKSWFTKNEGGDRTLRVIGDLVTWGSHLSAATSAGVSMLLFGAGVGDSTDGVGSPPSDDYWWITKSQQAYGLIPKGGTNQ